MGKSAIFWLYTIVYLGMLGLHVSHLQPVVPALFIFGDSTADVGTNNYLPESRARADFPYNGIDFPKSRATGRFSNGYNTIDYLAQLLNFYESPPPFLSFPGSNLSELIRTVPTKGVNFASGGSGLLHNTGQLKWRRVISFGEQVQQFSSVRSNISELLGVSAVDKISKSLFLISVGSNDIFEHFDAFFPNDPPTITGQNYLTNLISTYETHLTNLYDLGARKFGIISVGVIGCVPIQRAKKHGGCFKAMNMDSQLFYNALGGLLRKLSTEYKGFKYALGDAYEMSKYILYHPAQFGITEVRRACCGNGTLNAEAPCTPDARLCGDRTTCLFWDQYHPTQNASHLAAYNLFTGGAGGKFVKPMSFRDLALLP